MAMDKGKGLLMLIGRSKNADAEDSTDDKSAKSEESGESLIAAKAVLAAIKSDDAKKLDEALKSHYTLCE